MGSLAVKTDERVAGVSFDADRLIVDLMDGRTIAVPLAGSTTGGRDRRTRADWEVAGRLRHPLADIDEDLSVEGLLRGAPAARAA